MTWQAACFSNQPDKFHQVFLPLHLDHIRSRINLFPDIISTDNIDTFLPGLKSIEVIFATWGMLSLSEEQLDQLPNLKVIFYAAGSTDYFSAPYLGRGVKIVSAWQANAIPVAEFCLAHILLGCKGYFRNQREYTAPDRLSLSPNITLRPAIIRSAWR
ncbi:hypothetical protein [Leclercia sp. LSNIH1]|uniref:hypothetical protein n=1 Tax=Leclercia sp. LSNIH1 TaxID=1920114 RepID=UPI001E4CB07B|nr:hypothetical protein [Leclercia sp. LSNIH1]